MSKVNVSAALKQIPSRFDLINTAARRAHQLQKQEQIPLVDCEGDKVTVIALKEIAASRITNEIMDNQDRLNSLLHQQELKNLDYSTFDNEEAPEQTPGFNSTFEEMDRALQERFKQIDQEDKKK